MKNKAKDSLAEYTRAAHCAHRCQGSATRGAGLRAAERLRATQTSGCLALSQSSRSRWAWYELGRIKYTENRFAEALDCFQKALSIEPRNVKAENNLGLTLEGLSRTDEAIAAYRTALAWQQDSTAQSEQPMINLAIVLTDRQQLQEALTLALTADRISPEDPQDQ